MLRLKVTDTERGILRSTLRMSPIPVIGGAAVGWAAGRLSGALMGGLLATLFLSIGALIAYGIAERQRR
jgi:hypothetical protein